VKSSPFRAGLFFTYLFFLLTLHRNTQYLPSIMKDCKNFISFFFIVAVSILLIRPAVLFSSTSIQSLFNSTEGRVANIKSLVKKRKESIRVGNIITKEVENIAVQNPVLAFFLFARRQWLRKLLFALSLLLSQFSFLTRKRSTLFEIVPDNQHYLALSVIRI